MMDEPPDNTHRDVSAYVRRHAGSSAIAAILMCAYAFGALSVPDRTDLFHWCNWFFYYTLCIGGVAFGIVTVWCLAGHVLAIAVDGVLSLLVGVMFMLTGIGMLIGGGGMLNSVLITVFGWLFAGAGLRDLKTYQRIRQTDDTIWHPAEPAAPQQVSPKRVDADVSRPADSLAGQLKTRAAERGAAPVRESTVSGAKPAVSKDSPSASQPVEAAPIDTADDNENEPFTPPDGGFLASLAREPRPPRV